MGDINSVLQSCIDQVASDIHFTLGIPVTYRVYGELKKSGDDALTVEEIEDYIGQITSEEQRKELKESGNVEFGFHFKEGVRFRASIYLQKSYPAIVLRRVANDVMKMEDIGLPTHIKELLDKNHGLILVTGPTGSGKSTSLTSMIDYINETDDRHIITIEDPIEYVHSHKKSIVNQRELGQDTQTFAAGLKQALRQDPDVILVGEMRDLETIETVLTATETGHLVLSTLHTFGAARTLDRIIDVFPSHQQDQIRTQLSLNLAAVISQELIPRADKEGRIAAFEIMMLTPAIQNLLRKGQTFNIQNEIQTGANVGMISLQNQLMELVKNGMITKEDAIFYAIDQDDIKRRLGAA